MNSLTNYPNGVSSFGIPIIGAGPVFTTGNVFFVDSGSAKARDAADKGGSPETPFISIDFAVQRCTANNGDYIIVMPGHVETIPSAAALNINKAGITLIGIGSGSDRPTINFTTATTADMDIGAANITMVNFLFTGGIDALISPIDVNAADFAMYNCETRDVIGQIGTSFIVTDANADRMIIRDWVHRGAAGAGADAAINIVGGDNISIQDFWIDGNFSSACINNLTTAAVNLMVGSLMKECYARNRNSADVILAAVATTTGAVGPKISCRLTDDAANITEAFVGAAMNFYQPISIANADGQVGLNTNITASTDA